MIPSPKSRFKYKIVENYHNWNIIVIEDNADGRAVMSVTNDIEAVLDHIEITEKIDPRKSIIVYKDSDGIWDGWNATNFNFISLRKKDAESAAAYFILIMEGLGT